MLLLAAIELLAFLYSGAGMEAVAKQESLHLAIGLACREKFRRYLRAFLLGFHKMS